MCTFRTPYYKYQRYASSEKKSRDSSPKKPVVGCSLHPSAMRFFVLLFPAGSENLLLHFVKAALHDHVDGREWFFLYSV